ncbi:MAG: 3-hydroxyacyl-CoA dehydrogenase family protein [Bacteroidales bacterium]|nr:3-hydroxyacyl-CoA dehydrogenase family protein [Bacteroidales bacterium]
MNYVERMQRVAVLGAAGKMGSGILFLNLVECADLSLLPENKGKTFIVYAVDISEEALDGLLMYVKSQLRKVAEKKINWLREVYQSRQDLIENAEIINEYIDYVLSKLRLVTTIESSYNANIIFEAIKEDPHLKVSVLKNINENNKNKPWFFTNTSSIPIQYLNEQANLEGRIIGYHFYNPPVVQKLVELISAKNTLPEIKEFSYKLAERLNKTIVESNDIVGFIGNGHFMRDILHAVNEVNNLLNKFTFPEAVYIMNKVSQEYLIRPMGIFQLIDYVGIDVCSYIMNVMSEHLKDNNLKCNLLENMLANGIKGGQYADGSQKDGFLKYDKGKIVGVYDINSNQYIPLSDIQEKCDAALGQKPQKLIPWKTLINQKDKEPILTEIFNEMKNINTLGSKLAITYGLKSKEIAKNLVTSGVAKTEEDVNKVLITGFYHAYGPINNFFD